MTKKIAMTVRIDENEHKKIRKYLIEKDATFQEYVLYLLREDMYKNSKDKK